MDLITAKIQDKVIPGKNPSILKLYSVSLQHCKNEKIKTHSLTDFTGVNSITGICIIVHFSQLSHDRAHHAP